MVTDSEGLAMVSTLDTTIFDDTSFAQVLAVERKRTDRSHRPFLLLLIELQIRLWDGQRRKRALVKNVVQALRLCTRQTDMIGWYKPNAVIGVIYTELRHAGRSIDTILARVNAALQARLLPAQLQAIAITAYVYPQHEPGDSPAAP